MTSLVPGLQCSQSEGGDSEQAQELQQTVGTSEERNSPKFIGTAGETCQQALGLASSPERLLNVIVYDSL